MARIFLLLLLFLLLAPLACDDDVVYRAPECGNGVVENFEECDDGNLVSGDGCSNQCLNEYFEVCDNGRDDDSDGLIDCADPDCFDSGTCNGEICNNGIDDDLDGMVDCDDDDCRGSEFCQEPEDCGNGIDDDGDGATDCDDPVCGKHPLCGGCDPDDFQDDVTPGRVIGFSPDTFNFLYDPGCTDGATGFFELRLSLSEAASLTIDGTADEIFRFALTREEEPDVTCELDIIECLAAVSSTLPHVLPLVPPGTYRLLVSQGPSELTLTFGDPVFEKCANGIDDDGDGLVDCEDPVCTGEVQCLIEVCDNGVDDDLDGLADCDDPGCAVACAPSEECGNGLDDDLDGAMDCHDTDCIGTTACSTASCIVNRYLGTLSRGSFVTGSFDTTLTPHGFSTSCGGTGPDFVFAFDLEGPSHVMVHMSQHGAHALALATDGYSALCVDGELACEPPSGIHLPLTVTYPSLPSGRYYLLVDAVTTDASGYGDVEVLVAGADDELCTNGIDDDGDGQTDCDDLECSQISFCTGESLCHDDLDDDGDGWTDCADNDCIGSSACLSSACTADRFLGTLGETPLSALVDLAEGSRDLALACGPSLPQPGTVLSFSMAQPGRVRLRTIPVGFTEPVTALAFPGGAGAQCDDAQHLCSVVPAPGLANTVITQVSLPAGGPYYVLIAPYSSPATGTVQLILYLDQ